MIKGLERLLELAGKTKWYALAFVALLFISFTFREEIKEHVFPAISATYRVEEGVTNAVNIQLSLRGLMEKYDADRAYIFLFHNGVKYYNGSHKLKISCDYEVTQPGISREAEKLQDLPVGLFSIWINQVIQNRMYVDDINKIGELNVRVTLQEQGVTGLAVIPYYQDGKLIAVIGVDYVLRDYAVFNKERFKYDAQQVGLLLDNF